MPEEHLLSRVEQQAKNIYEYEYLGIALGTHDWEDSSRKTSTQQNSNPPHFENKAYIGTPLRNYNHRIKGITRYFWKALQQME